MVLPHPAGAAAGEDDRGGPGFFLHRHLDGQIKIAGASEPARRRRVPALLHRAGTIPAICEDYRAAATIDLDHDRADSDKRITAPLLALWGGRGTVGALYDVVETWREKALDARGRPLDCGHSPQEECPEDFLAELLPFLGG